MSQQLAPSSLAVRAGDSAAQLETEALQHKYERANALVSSVINRYYNGSARAVDPFVIRCIQDEETRLFSIQCFVEDGPAESRREHKESSVVSRAIRAPTFTFLDRIVSVCGGYLGGPGSVMRHWEELSDTGYDNAMREYIGVVDKIVPGWDLEPPLDYPVSRHDRFWKDDAAALQCQSCSIPFSVSTRRHHCRLCLDVFCYACCSARLELALCPGAPLRTQRVCSQCFEAATRDKQLLDVRRVRRANGDLEQQIKQLQVVTATQLAAKHCDETKLRQVAIASGCDMAAIDGLILQRAGSTSTSPFTISPPTSSNSCSSTNSNSATAAVSVATPPAHKFAPRESVEANEQLALAHRQLLMGLKVAQCRAQRALASMDVTLAVLRDAISIGGTAHWSVVLRCAHTFLTLRDVKALAVASKALRTVVERCHCERKCVLALGAAPQQRSALWQFESLRDVKTRLYVADLADAIRKQLDSDSDSSDSDSDNSDEHAPSKPLWLTLLDAPASVPNASTESTLTPAPAAVCDVASTQTSWDRAYALILVRCQASATALEYDAQIARDVQRTFGAPAHRTTPPKQYQCIGTTIPERAVEHRRSALVNVLRAFTSVNTEIGYCQGMDHVAAVVLSVVDWHEARAFWLLTSLVASPQYGLDALYAPGLPHLALRCYQLECVMAQHLPALGRYLTSIDFPVSLFATNWFLTLFTSMETLSYDIVLRVLDGFVVAGWKQIVRVALAILDALQHQILASAFDDIPQVFYDILTHAPQLTDVDDVLARAARFKVTTSQLKCFERAFETSSAATAASSSSITPSVVSSAKANKLKDSSDSPVIPTQSLASSPSDNANAMNCRVQSASTESSLNGSETSSSCAVRPTASTTSSKALQLAAAAATGDTAPDCSEKSPDSTRAATPLRTSIATTRLVV